MKRWMFIVGFVLIIGAVGVRMQANAYYQDRIREGWQWGYDLQGNVIYSEEPGDVDESLFDTPIDTDDVLVERFGYEIQETDIDTNTITLLETYAELDPISGVVDYSEENVLVINARTGKFMEEDLSSFYFVFPQNVQKQSYQLWDSYWGETEANFDREDTFAGSSYYVFTVDLDVFDETFAWEGFIPEDTSALCYDVHLEWWVEPVTGEVVRAIETCPESWAVDADRQRLYPLGRWHYETTLDSHLRYAAFVQSRRRALLLNTQYIPIGLGIAGLILLIGGLLPFMQHRHEPKGTA